MAPLRLRRPTLLLVLAIVIGPPLVYLLWPLHSGKLHITVDQDKLRGRQAYLAAAPPPPPADRPNVILILADDLGKTDISLHGSPLLRTPRIDSIGQDGVTFTEGYITSPICSPSRAGLMTGRYQQRFGHEIQPHDRYPRNRLEYYVFKYLLARGDWRVADPMEFPAFEDLLDQGLPPSELTLAEVLKRAGYSTAIMGKWHLGAGDQAIPLHRGFDYHYGFYEAFSLYADPQAPDIVNQRHDDFSDPFLWAQGRKGNCAIRRNGDVIEERVYLTEKIAAESVAWLAAHRQGPFFLYVPFNAPHAPFQVPRVYFDRFAHIKDRNQRVYLAMIAALDDGVGRILDQVAALGLARNTLVFFLSDNGGATYTGATDNAPLRGGKFTNFEGGINVPFLLRWPSRIPPGTRFAAPVSALDVFATVAAQTGSALPGDRPYDGVDLVPYVLSPGKGPPHEALYWRSEYHKAIRKGAFKLIRDDMSGRTSLYDIPADPGEQRNLAAARPEIVAELLRDLGGWERQMRSSLWPRVMDYRFLDRGEEYFFPL